MYICIFYDWMCVYCLVFLVVYDIVEEEYKYKTDFPAFFFVVSENEKFVRFFFLCTFCYSAFSLEFYALQWFLYNFIILLIEDTDFNIEPVSYGILNPMVNWPRGQNTIWQRMLFKLTWAKQSSEILPSIWVNYVNLFKYLPLWNHWTNIYQRWP